MEEIDERIEKAVLNTDDIRNRVDGLSVLALATLIAVPIVGGISAYLVETGVERNLNAVSNDIFEVKADIQDLKKSREENYEKRFEELATRIAELESKLEERDIYETESIVLETAVEETEFSKERLPEGVDTNRYDCEHYTFGSGSYQYYLQLECFTDERGLRYFYYNGKKYYCVAMGGAYGIDIGDIWNVTLECGTEFGIILSDYQHSITDVDPYDFGECYERDIYGNVVGILRNYDEEPVVHVLEFIVDMDQIPRSVAMAGTVSALPEFGGLYGNGGNIVDISYQGRAWSV